MKPTTRPSKVTLFLFIAVVMLSIVADRALSWSMAASSRSATEAGAVARLPDLVIDNFELSDPVKGQVNVEVLNKGGGSTSAPCTLRLIVWEPGKFEQKEAKTVFVKVPSIHSGKSVKVVALAGVPIINTKYSLFIDISEEVAERDEKNNRAEGEAGNFKP